MLRLNAPNNVELTTRFLQLDTLLTQTRPWWEPAPFTDERPAWPNEQGDLTTRLLALSDAEVDALERSDAALSSLLTPYIPLLAPLRSLSNLPDLRARRRAAGSDQGCNDVYTHYSNGAQRHIRGRKWEQIRQFAACTSTLPQPVLEWCGGKGHLGRLLAHGHAVPITTWEQDGQLCADGARLAALAGVDQSFVRCDVLSDQSATNSKWGTVVTLHACGSLHRHLLRQGIADVDTTFYVAPCCYHLGFVDDYPTFNSQATLRLSQPLTRIAVAQTCTANGYDRRARQRLQSWKLGIQALRRAIMGQHDGVVLGAIPAAWARGDFRGFCARVAARQQWDVPASIDWDYWEREGLRRLNAVRRLELIRCSFRRMIELWLVWDMATALQQEGREVEVGSFCDVAVSPRNILIIARPAGQIKR